MNKENTFVINLGGSLIMPDEIDVDFLKKFRDLIVNQIENHNKKFVFITGGGATARKYQSSAEEVSESISDEDKDWLGIHSTRLNAQLIRTIFRKYAHPKINTNPYDLEDFYSCDNPIMIAAGWKPGFSTDYDTALISKFLGIKKIINLSNISYIYNKDPKKYSDAEIVEEMSWYEFCAMVGDKWTPGMHAPFDPVAAKFANKEDLEVVTMSGENLQNLENYLNNEKFEGSVICNG